MSMMPLLFAQNNNSSSLFGSLCGLVCNCAIFLVIVVPTIAGIWKTFEKAGKPGWAALIPFYNTFVLTEVARKEILWFVLTLIPCVNIVAIIVICMDVAKNFGKDPLYGIGLALLPFIFFPLLGFSDARYEPAGPFMPPV
jgi:uncharacterized membrane protein YhaH (DUF805 family)